jgi:hypothetical protein
VVDAGISALRNRADKVERPVPRIAKVGDLKGRRLSVGMAGSALGDHGVPRRHQAKPRAARRHLENDGGRHRIVHRNGVERDRAQDAARASPSRSLKPGGAPSELSERDQSQRVAQAGGRGGKAASFAERPFSPGVVKYLTSVMNGDDERHGVHAVPDVEVPCPDPLGLFCLGNQIAFRHVPGAVAKMPPSPSIRRGRPTYQRRHYSNAPSSLLFVEMPQVGAWLTLAERHQQAVAAEHVLLATDADVDVALGTDRLHPDRMVLPLHRL